MRSKLFLVSHLIARRPSWIFNCQIVVFAWLFMADQFPAWPALTMCIIIIVCIKVELKLKIV